MATNEMYYGDYLQLDKILNAQDPESKKQGKEAHDEMLFIIVHQAYELWFKQIQYELNSILDFFRNPINDNSPSLELAVHRFKRINVILTVAIEQINIMETMTPLDFLDFRNLLRPASGFQSFQFKQIEAALGLKMANRHGKEYYLAQLRKEHIDAIKKIEEQDSLLELIVAWLERMPFFEDKSYWSNYKPGPSGKNDFWLDYKQLYSHSLSDEEQMHLKSFDLLFTSEDNPEKSLSPKANRAALFIMLYRDYPLLQLPFQLINSLLDIDELMATWRYRHVNMVQRTIGTRIGTGGSSGKDYLRAALEKHYIFREFTELTSYLIERRNLPELSPELESHLGFVRS